MVTIEKLKNLPQFPGVYLMKGNNGEILYIGKAKNIKNRVRSYFHETENTRYTVKFLSSKVSDIEYIVTTTDKEAIILEDTLVKKYKPKYNIRLKDDKTYVSIKFTLQEKFPRILITRQIKNACPRNLQSGNSRSPIKSLDRTIIGQTCVDKYFGPYASAQKARETIKFIRHLFPLCSCSPSEFKNRIRPCLDYQLGICSAPCVNLISEIGYRELLNKTIMFLEGRNKVLLSTLKTNMTEASHSEAFEKAAKIRDQIKAIEATLEEQKVVSTNNTDSDIFAHFAADDALLIQALFIRNGKLGGAKDFFFNKQELPMEEVFYSFLTRYYSGDIFIPDEIVISLPIEDKDTMEDWLSEKKGKKIRLFSPVKGNRFKLLKMAEANAKESLKRRNENIEKKFILLEELKKRLRLKKLPKIIEAFDISNMSGKMAVGAMVVFEDAKPNKDRYRLYKIKTIEQPDDYGMLNEVLSRRYKNAVAEANLPDMILIDGGKGQLNIAINIMNELGINNIDLAAIAKEHPPQSPLIKGEYPSLIPPLSRGGRGGYSDEKVYLPNIKDPVILKDDTPADLFVKQIRDEVHRFAIAYHKKLRGKIKSTLDEIPGIGKAKRALLLKHFGSIEKIKEASVEDIAQVSGINTNLAGIIKRFLSKVSG